MTRKMWKHILVQGLYQLFWLFFFMYALPTLKWGRYKITSSCELVTSGPRSAPQPGYCLAQMTAPRDAGGFGLDAAAAGTYCTLLTECGLPCGGGSPACASALALAGGPVLAPGAPFPAGGERAALCGPEGGKCDAYSAYRKVEMFWESKHEKQEEADFKVADSLLFNSFIWAQVRGARGGGGGRRRGRGGAKGGWRWWGGLSACLRGALGAGVATMHAAATMHVAAKRASS